MTKIKTFEVTDFEGNTVEHIEIETAEGHFTSMPKSVYDELKANEAKTF
jgi:hypothetical protein